MPPISINRILKISRALFLLSACWFSGLAMQSAELNASCESSPGPKPMLGLIEYAGVSEMDGSPIRFALYSDRTVIYRDEKIGHGNFMTGTVDDETWQLLSKIVAELPEVKVNFAFTDREGQKSSLVIFNDGKVMRELAMVGPVSAKKNGTGAAVSYSTSVPAVQCESSYYGSGEVPSGAVGAWYETRHFTLKDARPWVPDFFVVKFSEGVGSKTVSWPANWPQLSEANTTGSSVRSLKIPGKFLPQFERLFTKNGTACRVSGRTWVVSYSVTLPSEHTLLAAIPVGVPEESMRSQSLLPIDFLQKTKLSDVSAIAKQRDYKMMRIESAFPSSTGAAFVRSADVIEELCQSNDNEKLDVGLDLTLKAERNPLRTASVIASTHPTEVTQALIIRHITDGKFLEIVTPLIQESVARGADYDSVEPIKAYWEKCRQLKEPLTWLPLHRTDIERSISVPSYSNGGSVSHLPTTSVNGKLDKTPPRTTPEKPFTGLLVDFNGDAAARCAKSWSKREAKLFETPSVISADDVSTKQMLKLRLDCLAGATPGEVKFENISAERLFEILFGVASNGGAYGGNEFGAHGRLAAWQSVAALCGVDANASFDDVYKAAKQSSWYSITSKSKWFCNIAWDFGVVCLRPDKRHLAVLAATDED